ncbi:hypothetical protein AAHZ94_23885 [Streptomyces sp. HSW2009]|uniref:hypothetical protein n=1 Tax=Streptomyces sp. HSW2009 TaxID=3142890 RepID=UPI0032F04661
MPHLTSYDGVTLAYSLVGAWPPLVCLAGGPGADGRGLGDLGGLALDRELIRLDGRAAGRSAVPTDAQAVPSPPRPATYWRWWTRWVWRRSTYWPIRRGR